MDYSSSIGGKNKGVMEHRDKGDKNVPSLEEIKHCERKLEELE